MASDSMVLPPCCAPGGKFDALGCCTVRRYQSHGIGKGYTGGFHEYFGPDADIDS